MRGTRSVQIVPGLRTRNISVCCAMSKNALVKYLSKTTPFNTVSFESFIESLLDRCEELHAGPVVIVMDNVPFHKSVVLRQAIERRGCMVQLLPPYSPFMNPIENIYQYIKQYINISNKLFQMAKQIFSVLLKMLQIP